MFIGDSTTPREIYDHFHFMTLDEHLPRVQCIYISPKLEEKFRQFCKEDEYCTIPKEQLERPVDIVMVNKIELKVAKHFEGYDYRVIHK